MDENSDDDDDDDNNGDYEDDEFEDENNEHEDDDDNANVKKESGRGRETSEATEKKKGTEAKEKIQRKVKYILRRTWERYLLLKKRYDKLLLNVTKSINFPTNVNLVSLTKTTYDQYCNLMQYSTPDELAEFWNKHSIYVRICGFRIDHIQSQERKAQDTDAT